jgi:hypothetical protein
MRPAKFPDVAALEMWAAPLRAKRQNSGNHEASWPPRLEELTGVAKAVKQRDDRTNSGRDHDARRAALAGPQSPSKLFRRRALAGLAQLVRFKFADQLVTDGVKELAAGIIFSRLPQQGGPDQLAAARRSSDRFEQTYGPLIVCPNSRQPCSDVRASILGSAEGGITRVALLGAGRSRQPTPEPRVGSSRSYTAAGANLRQIQEPLGHKHLDSTQRYTRVNAHQLRAAIKRR